MRDKRVIRVDSKKNRNKKRAVAAGNCFHIFITKKKTNPSLREK